MDDFQFRVRFRPMWPIMNTMPIVHDMIDRMIEDEGHELIAALAVEIERLKALGNEEVAESLAKHRQKFIEIWGEKDGQSDGDDRPGSNLPDRVAGSGQ